jgi:hypothetical protein
VEVTKMTQLMRHGPWWLAGLERQMDELSGALGDPSRSWVIPAGTGRWVPACDVVSRDGDLVVRLDLPGIDPAKDVPAVPAVRPSQQAPEAGLSQAGRAGSRTGPGPPGGCQGAAAVLTRRPR